MTETIEERDARWAAHAARRGVKVPRPAPPVLPARPPRPRPFPPSYCDAEGIVRADQRVPFDTSEPWYREAMFKRDDDPVT